MPRPLKEKTATQAGASAAMASFADWFRLRLRGLKTQLISRVPRLLKEVTPWAGAWMAVAALANLLRDLNVQLMGMAVAWLVLILLQCIVGPMRRYSEHWLVQYGAMAGYYLHFPLALRAVSTALDSSETRIYHTLLCITLPVWSFYFMMSGPMPSAYTRPIHSDGWRVFQAIYSCYCLLSLAFKQDLDNNGKEPPVLSPIIFKIVVILVIIMTVACYVGLSRSMTRITSAREERAKEFAIYMEEEANSQGPCFFFELEFDGNATANNDSLDRCKYPIMLNARHRALGYRNMFKINRVMDVRPYFWTDLQDRPVPDIFLSYTFFQLLARRYFGLHCAEEGNEKVRDFALKELMQQDYKRAFTVVEAQLAFLHDEFFYTDRWNLALVNEFQVGPAVMLLGILTLGIWRDSSSPPITVYTYYPLVCILGCVFLFYEMGLLMASDWHTIGNAIIVGGLFTSPWNINWETSWFRQPYWKNKIGQYSLIKDYDSCSAKRMSLFLLKSIISWKWPASFIEKHYPVEEPALALSEPDHDSVRELVARTLQGINGAPTNGISSLHRNRARIMDDLSWTCRQRTDTHTILIWHIATCYFELGSEETSTNYKVATALSRYCAYLVAFHPEFIPQDKLTMETTKSVFEGVLKEAKHHLSMDQEARRNCKCLQKVKAFLGLRKDMSKEKKIKMKGLHLPREAMSTFEKGVWLGRQLEKLEDTSVRWEVMAEFWAETILYIAPSDNVALHFEHLAKGGEFVTHLWAMLSNAGILKQARPQRRRADESILAQQPQPAAPVVSE